MLFSTLPCVDSKRLRVCIENVSVGTHNTSLCLQYTRRRFECTHGGVLNRHTGRGEVSVTRHHQHPTHCTPTPHICTPIHPHTHCTPTPTPTHCTPNTPTSPNTNTDTLHTNTPTTHTGNFSFVVTDFNLFELVSLYSNSFCPEKFCTSDLWEVHQNGIAPLSPSAQSPHRVKRSVSASLAGGKSLSESAF